MSCVPLIGRPPKIQGIHIGGVFFKKTPAGLVHQTPLTNDQMRGIMRRPLPHPDGEYTLEENPAALVSMHKKTGHAYVISRGPLGNVGDRFMSPVAIAGEKISIGIDHPATMTRGVVVDLTPTSRLYGYPEFDHHPLVKVSWLQGAAIAAALTDMDENYVVHMITEAVFDRIIDCDEEMTEDQVISMAHLKRDGVKGTASVVGEAAQSRTNKWGIVDAFGNVWVWLQDTNDLKAIERGESIQKVARVPRGDSLNIYPQCAKLYDRGDLLDPFYDSIDGGVRFVAVPRSPQ